MEVSSQRICAQVNKVTLKLDVTHTEHSHVIGKGGGNIKKVMEETSCHIHFPDSNRNSLTGEKSNQVIWVFIRITRYKIRLFFITEAH